MAEISQENAPCGVYRKLNAMQRDALSLNWEKDKPLIMSGRIAYYYLSAEKLKANIAHLLADNGVVFTYEIYDVEQRPAVGERMSNHWSAMFRGTLTDMDSGESISSSVFCEAADGADKAASKLATTGYKLYWFNILSIADGFDSYDTPAPADNTHGSAQVARVSAVSIPPTAAPKTPSVPKTEAPKTEAPKTEVPAEPAAPEAAEEPKADAPAEVPAEPVAEAPAEPAPEAPKAPSVPKAEAPKAPKAPKAPSAPKSKKAEAPESEAPISESQKTSIANIVAKHPELKEQADALTTAKQAKKFVFDFFEGQ